MTSAHEDARTQLIPLAYKDPIDVFEVLSRTDVRRRAEAPSSSSVTDVSSISWGHLHEAIVRLTENVRASENWLDTTDQILHRIDQHATAVASKELFSDRISQFLRYDESISRSFLELAVSMLGSAHEAADDEQTEGEERVFGNAQYIQKLRYESALSDILSGANFQGSEPYVDQHGGLIVDYFRDSDRITLAFSAEDIQVLTYIKEQFANKVFTPIKTSQLDVRNFLDNLLLAT